MTTRARTPQDAAMQWGVTLLALFAVSLLASIKFPLSQSMRVVFGVWLALFLPGYMWSFVFWKRGALTALERTALAVVLSMVVVSLSTYALHQIGVRISSLSAFSTAVVSTLAGVAVRAVMAGRSRTGTAATQPDSTQPNDD